MTRSKTTWAGRRLLIGIALAIPLATAAPAAASTTTLYSQLGKLTPTFRGLSTQNFETAFDADDDQGADDFTVPKRRSWKLTEVDFDGGYTSFGGSNVGPTDSFNVFLYKNAGGLPGKSVDTQKSLPFTVRGKRTLVVKLKDPVHLGTGHYWVSVQANQDATTAGQFFWIYRKIDGTKLPAAWENPGDGFTTGCTEWAAATECTGGTHDSLSFALRGTSKKRAGKTVSHRALRAPRAARSAASGQAASSLSPFAAGTSAPPRAGLSSASG